MNRRTFASRVGGATLALTVSPWVGAVPGALRRIIPRTGELLPAIGMGTYRTFHVGKNEAARAQRVAVLEAFFDAGGGMVDSSPMYGFSEEVVGDCLRRITSPQPLFSASKVWTLGRSLGASQMENSAFLWNLKRFDLMQIHNLLDWQTHVSTLQAWREEGRVRYLGVTTSHGRKHDLIAKVLETGIFDFVQLTYNVLDREVERHLLPLATDLGIAVIVNRPFQGGRLFGRLGGQPLPVWAADFDCHNWAQFFLKFILSHPSVTCAIPATSQPLHLRENKAAGLGRLPDHGERKRMVAYVEQAL